MNEKNCFAVSKLQTLGFNVWTDVGNPSIVCALTSVLITTVFPPPVGPITMVECLVIIVSYN